MKQALFIWVKLSQVPTDRVSYLSLPRVFIHDGTVAQNLSTRWYIESSISPFKLFGVIEFISLLHLPSTRDTCDLSEALTFLAVFYSIFQNTSIFLALPSSLPRPYQPLGQNVVSICSPRQPCQDPFADRLRERSHGEVRCDRRIDGTLPNRSA